MFDRGYQFRLVRKPIALSDPIFIGYDPLLIGVVVGLAIDRVTRHIEAKMSGYGYYLT